VGSTFVAAEDAFAHEPPAITVVVSCDAVVPCDEFAARVRGQTRELRARVETRRAPSPRDEAPTIASARALARSTGAEIVFWWRGGVLVAYVVRGDDERVFERAVATRSPWEPNTVDLETGSLIARTVVAATLRGIPQGEPIVEAPEPTTEPAAPAPPRGRASRWGAWAAAGGNLRWDDLPGQPAPGLDVRLGASVSRLRVGAGAALRRDSDVSAFGATGLLGRQELFALAEVTVVNAGVFELAVQGHAGRARFVITPVAVAGPALEFRRTFGGAALIARRRWEASGAAVWAGAGFDAFDGPLSVGVRSGDAYFPLWQMRRFQPLVAAGVEVEFPKRR
jgi:hypothetical protein